MLVSNTLDVNGRLWPGAILMASLILVTAGLFAAESIQSANIRKGDQESGTLWVSFGGKEIRIADHAVRVWVIGHGEQLVFSGTDGAGGYENEGQSLWLYEPQMKPRKLLAEYYAIDGIQETVTSTGKKALVVSMRDGGLGASHLAVVDPARGEVFAVSKAKLIRQDGDVLVVGFFKEDDWEPLNEGKKVVPMRT